MNTVRRMSLYEALRAAVEACGGAKAVGSTLWPAKHPEEAGRECGHCMQAGHKRKFDPTEIDFIFAWAERIGAHSAIEGWCAGRGYTTTPNNREAVLAELQTRAVDLSNEADQLRRDMAAISDLSPATRQLMRAANLRIDA